MRFSDMIRKCNFDFENCLAPAPQRLLSFGLLPTISQHRIASGSSCFLYRSWRASRPYAAKQGACAFLITKLERGEDIVI
ncbi:hypothetical protein HW35_10200 [Bacillus sp. X1(2014)]|nr:hypothetical protein HW35_10200 [Bacillus sp. X1(2014)]